MSNVQARLIASALALVATAIILHSPPMQTAGTWALFLTGALFVVEYGRANVPDRGTRAE